MFLEVSLLYPGPILANFELVILMVQNTTSVNLFSQLVSFGLGWTSNTLFRTTHIAARPVTVRAQTTSCARSRDL